MVVARCVGDAAVQLVVRQQTFGGRRRNRIQRLLLPGELQLAELEIGQRVLPVGNRLLQLLHAGFLLAGGKLHHGRGVAGHAVEPFFRHMC